MPKQAEYTFIQGGPQKIEKEIQLLAAQGFKPILMSCIGTDLSNVVIFVILEHQSTG
jgi:hypothetical protein